MDHKEEACVRKNKRKQKGNWVERARVHVQINLIPFFIVFLLMVLNKEINMGGTIVFFPN